MTEEIEDDVDDDLEDEVQSYTDDEWEEMMIPVVIDAVLDGRLPSTAIEFEHAFQAGLELGLVVECEGTESGFALSRDLEAVEEFAEGLALAQEESEAAEGDLELGSTESIGRAAYQAGMHAATGRTAVKRLATRASVGIQKLARRVKVGAKRAVGSTIRKNPGTAAAYAGTVLGGGVVGGAIGRATKNPLHADAERRSGASNN